LADITLHHLIGCSSDSGNHLACLALELRLRGKSIRQSLGTPIYYVDITLWGGTSLKQTLVEAKATAAQQREAGFEKMALDQDARIGLNQGAFKEDIEYRGLV
jgi:hypothetical protein